MLLVCLRRIRANDASPSDGVERLIYTIVNQDVDEVQDIQNASAVSITRFLTEREQMELVPSGQSHRTGHLSPRPRVFETDQAKGQEDEPQSCHIRSCWRNG